MDRFELNLFTKDLGLIYCLPLDEEVFARLCVDAYFDNVRQGRIVQQSWLSEIRPLWGAEKGPVASGIEVAIETEDGRSLVKHFGVEVFGPLVQRLCPELVRRGLLNPDETFNYLLRVQPGKVTSRQESRHLEIPASVPRPSRYFPNDSALPVVIAFQVLEEVWACAQSSSDEVGGVLIGHLGKSDGKLGVEIKAQLLARYAESKQQSFRFLARTWNEVYDTIRIRQQDEVLLGWWHSHPFEHRRSSTDNNGEISPNLFMSVDDLFLHENFFSAPWQVALVVDPQARKKQSPYGLFGWQDGIVQPRGFTCLEGDTR